MSTFAHYGGRDFGNNGNILIYCDDKGFWGSWLGFVTNFELATKYENVQYAKKKIADLACKHKINIDQFKISHLAIERMRKKYADNLRLIASHSS